MEIEAIIITDTHLNEKNIELNKSIFRQAKNIAINNGLKHIFHGGDIFDARKGQTDTLLKMFEDILDDLHKDDIVLIAIPGNHDKSDYSSMNSYLDPFKHHPAFKLIRSYGFEKTKNYNLYLLPYFREADVYPETLSYLLKDYGVQLNQKKKHVLITHIAISGVRNNDGSLIENQLGENVFSKFDTVLIGHYHDKQKIGSKFHYIGSSMQHNYGEDLTKGFTVLKSDGSVVLIEAEFPKYVTVNIDILTTSKSDIVSFINKHENSEDNVRFVLFGKQEELKSIDQGIFKKAGIDVKFKPEEIVFNETEIEENHVISFDKKTIVDEFNNFIKINSINNEKQGLNYLKKCL